jgi:holo-[acyl-carrier protein] synthase
MKGISQGARIDDACCLTRKRMDETRMSPGFGSLQAPQLGADRLRMGMDVVDIRRINESIDKFGTRFLQRLFSDTEISYALDGEGQAAQRLAARFAAKEAAIKAFNLSETGVSWRDIEVQKQPDGACSLALHGRAAVKVAELGVSEIALSLSHDGDYAAAVVTALLGTAQPHLS